MVIKSFQMPIGNGHWESNFFNGYFSPIVVENDKSRRNDRDGRALGLSGNENVPQGSSTPLPKKITSNVSWVDVDEDEDNVVDNFIASVLLHGGADGQCVASSEGEKVATGEDQMAMKKQQGKPDIMPHGEDVCTCGLL